MKLEFGNMFDVKNIRTADIDMLEFQSLVSCCLIISISHDVIHLVYPFLTYLDLRKTWSNNIYFPYRQLENNKNLSDRQ